MMTETATQKLYDIADHFGDLNKKGMVKAFKGNNKGYARIADIKRGCSIFVVHENDDSVNIALYVSQSAEEKYPHECKDAIEVIKQFFQDELKSSDWTHCIDKDFEKTRYFTDVTEKSSSEIINVANSL